ncbi:MAG: dihydropteroate synthase-like protein [Asgard group archaeon]|nr:dihydropteroate synthase-like protein [Asgard group archaeon]
MKKNTKDNTLPKILVLTGRAAEPIVRKYIPENVDLLVLPVDVAAFITSEMILENLNKKTAQNYELIVTPGLVQDDLTYLKNKLGILVVKGPRYASDIKMAIIDTDPFTLSPVVSADKYLKKQKATISRDIIEQGFTAPLEKNEYYIGFKKKFPVGLNRPPLVMAEIVDAPKLSMEKITERALYYLRNGADILDIGALANEPEPQKISKIVKKLKSLQEQHGFAISVDTLEVEEIQAAIKEGVDLILSIDHGNVDYLIDDIPKNVGVVFVPTNVEKGYLPKTSQERVKSLIQLRDKLKAADLTKIAADPIIEMPIYPGFTNSLSHYIEYRKIDSETPMMTCVGNVTEFIAADPIGINALFSCISVELGIQLLLVTDVSAKCRGGIKEIVKSRDLAFVAKQKDTPPKGHGIEILMAKSRTANDIEIVGFKNIETLEITTKDENKLYRLDYEPDPKGSFTIWIDYHKQKIYTAHLKVGTNKPDLLLISSKARLIYEEIIKRNLITKIDHAFYMGRELERAEVCLYLGKTYIQNKQTFCDEKII